MTFFRLIAASLLYHRRMNVAVALGVAVGTAVLTGALVVGDSVRGSLRHLTLDRLGVIDEVLVTDRFFRASLADELQAAAGFKPAFVSAAPAIVLEGSVSQPDSGTRANHVNLLGGDERVWRAWAASDDGFTAPKPDEVVLNEPLATALGVRVGQDILVRLPTPADIPRDSALGRKTETITNRRLKVSGILPAQRLGLFSLRPNQALPRNAYLNLHTLQEALRQPERVNAIFVLGSNDQSAPTAGAHDRLQSLFHPRLDDLGLSIKPNQHGYFLLASERMLIEPAADVAARKAFPNEPLQPVLTYLANTLAIGSREIPYSTVAAINLAASPPLGPWTTTEGAAIVRLTDEEIILSQWAADDLEAKPGDKVRLVYFEPESTHGKVREATAEFTLKAVCAMTGPAVDRDLTPELPGVTDQLSIADWNPPFPFDSGRVRKKDEAYWDDYRATPKAFVSLAAGRRLWSSRFGQTTSLRLAPAPGDEVNQAEADKLASRWQPDTLALGFEFRPVKERGLAASAGTTPFNLLFLGFSMFLIAAALMLVALLFRLGIEQRAREVGILRGVGLAAGQVRRLLLCEGALVTAGGSALGVGLGVAYAWLMLTGLRTWWVAAVTTPFLQLHITPASLLIGGVCGAITSLLAIVWAMRQLRAVAVPRLLAGDASETTSLVPRSTTKSCWIAAVCVVLAAVVSLAGRGLTGEAQAGAFFGAGALVLTALLTFMWARLRSGATGALITTGGLPIVRLALRNGARHPGRSTLTMGLVASASFLILAISAFHVEPPERSDRRDTGTGGFALVAESDQPLYADLDDADGRFDLGFSTQDEQALKADQMRAFALRVQAGDDASCLNLYQTQQPRVLGVTDRLIARGGFEWATTAATTAEDRANPWRLLEREGAIGSADAPVPVALDFATAVYSLHLSGGVGDRFDIADGRGGRLHLEVVGLLKNSVFQGTLLVAERAVLRHFPDVGGYAFFLIDCSPEQLDQTQRLLGRVLGDYGFDAQPSRDRLAGYLAVQNTYLETFQSLGGLGLLLGTFGLAIVQLRNVLERRGELALLQATGFRRALLGRLVLFENAALLLGGLAIGALAALVALAPHLGSADASVPWASLAITLSIVVAVGLLAGLLAVRAVLTTPLLAALRGE